MTPAAEANRLKGIALNEAKQAARAARRSARRLRHQETQQRAQRAAEAALEARIAAARAEVVRRYMAAYWTPPSISQKEIS